VFASEDVVFAWAMGKALLIVIVSIGILVYLAWVVTRPEEIAAPLEDDALRSRSSIRASKVSLIANGTAEEAEGTYRILATKSAEEDNAHEWERPAAAA
jgi:hypothetical protein